MPSRLRIHIIGLLLIIAAGPSYGASGIDTSDSQSVPPTEVSKPPLDESGVLSFRAWKNKKIESALKEVVRLRRQAALDTAIEAEDIQNQLSQARMNLAAVQELSVPEYFAIYLSQQPNLPQAFLAAAEKLEPNELAELLAAYDKKLKQNEDAAASKEMRRLGRPSKQSRNP